MDKKIFAKTGYFLVVLLIPLLILSGCASSDVSRQTASGIDSTAANAKRLINNFGQTNIADEYQNANQAVKGAVIGGSVGAIAGSLTSGVGVIPGTAVGAILGASYGSYLDSRMVLEDVLENRGVNIVVLGDQIMIVIPSARLFESWTSAIKPEAYSTLKLVVTYINRFAKMSVRVSGYTDDTGSPTVDCALSQQQADQLVRVLEKLGINARLLTGVGLGGTHLVSPTTLAWDNDNYRMEITFEKLYV